MGPDPLGASEIGRVPSQAGEMLETKTIVDDAVFGQMSEKGPNYRNVRAIPILNTATLIVL